MANSAIKLSEGMAAAVAGSGASIVQVKARRRMPASGIVWNEDGLIVTASHVVRRDSGIKIGLPNGEKIKASLVGRDNSTDLAVLKADDGDFSAISLANSDDLAVGQIAIAAARPGKSVQATLGIISALGDSWRTGAGGAIDRYLQTDVLMYPGFSGGALINVSGELIGLNSSALGRGVSLTIPHPTLTRVVNALTAHGKIKRGYLGVSTQTVRLPKPLRAELGQETGLLIAGVETDSPAEKGGILLGDTLLALDGNAIRQHDDLLALLQGERVGKKCPVKLLRGGKTKTVQIMVGEKG